MSEVRLRQMPGIAPGHGLPRMSRLILTVSVITLPCVSGDDHDIARYGSGGGFVPLHLHGQELRSQQGSTTRLAAATNQQPLAAMLQREECGKPPQKRRSEAPSSGQCDPLRTWPVSRREDEESFGSKGVHRRFDTDG